MDSFDWRFFFGCIAVCTILFAGATHVGVPREAGSGAQRLACLTLGGRADRPPAPERQPAFDHRGPDDDLDSAGHGPAARHQPLSRPAPATRPGSTPPPTGQRCSASRTPSSAPARSDRPPLSPA